MTIIAKFDPIWDNQSNLGSFSERQFFTVQLATRNRSVTHVPISTNALDCGSFSSHIVSITINGVATTFFIAGTTVVFAPTTAISSVIEIISSKPNTISLLCENLPPGVSVSSSGLISGPLGAIASPADTTEFNFVLRASNASSRVADMAFVISGTRLSSDFIDMSLLPEVVFDPLVNSDSNLTGMITGINYIPLGFYQPSQSVAYSIDAINGAGAPALISIDPSFFVLDNDNMKYTGPPDGLELSGTEIVGQIAAATPPGLYLFRVQGTIQSLVFGIEVIPYAGIAYAPPETLRWLTLPYLGSIEEGVPCYLSVTAVTDRSPVCYSLLARSSNFPPGLMLAPTGEITGKLAYGLSNASYAFTIRATLGSLFIDRDFTLSVVSKYNSLTVYDIGFALEMQQADAFAAPYASIITQQLLFRADDNNFGMATPFIYLFAGIDGTLDLTSVLHPELLPAITNNSYFAPIRFMLGEHIGTTVNDSRGNPVYDVVYRKLYEFDADGGGFTTGNTPVASPVLYPQSRVSGGIYVFPVCTRNMRCKLLATFGFATNTNSNILGPSGGENPPLWMRGNYVPALPIAFVLPGTAMKIAAALNASSIVAPNGVVYTFDRLYCGGGVTKYLEL